MVLDSLFSQLQNARIPLIATLIVILTVRYVRSPWRKVPPGPKGLPILGNVFQRHDNGWMFGTECKRKFGLSISFSLSLSPTLWLFTFTMKLSGQMMYSNVFGQPFLVINSPKTAFELLDRRANIYSDRPRYVVANKILCGGLFTIFLSYGDVLVCSFFSKILEFKLSLLFVGGVVIAAPHMKFSPRRSFVITTRFSAKRRSSLHPQYSKTHSPWIKTSSAPPHQPPSLYYTTIPPSRTTMTRPLRSLTPLPIAYRLHLPLEHI